MMFRDESPAIVHARHVSRVKAQSRVTAVTVGATSATILLAAVGGLALGGACALASAAAIYAVGRVRYS